MKGGRRRPWSPITPRGLHTSTFSIFFLGAFLACGGERRSGAAPVSDTGQTSAIDTTATATGDSAPVTIGDTARPAARTDTAPRPADTARTSLARKPAPQKSTPKPAAPKPAAPAQPASPDTSPVAAPATDTAAADTAAAAPSQASTPLRDPYHQAPRDTVSQQVYDGWKQFNLNCARCHGEDVQGTTIAPHLIVSLKPDGPMNTKELFVQTVCAGRPEKGMPSWCALGMETPTIEAIYAYVKGRSEAKIHPGRPAVKAGG
jgi:mono/diheme cytochrome c family protein